MSPSPDPLDLRRQNRAGPPAGPISRSGSRARSPHRGGPIPRVDRPLPPPLTCARRAPPPIRAVRRIRTSPPHPVFELPTRDQPKIAETLLAVRPHHLANAVVAFLFASTGPVALILTIGIAGGLSTETLSSWIFIGFVAGGAITFAMSWLYKQPLAFAWTISGTAIAGQALLKYPFAEIVGAYMVTGAVMILLGLSGGFKAIMRFVPQPIVMAMV
ncbi:MAG: hypothetical protein F4233_15250, partial [Rhodospirillaceae bacterium]|nr:hypothetical protein [Rhodospirillaceae bacterium]